MNRQRKTRNMITGGCINHSRNENSIRPAYFLLLPPPILPPLFLLLLLLFLPSSWHRPRRLASTFQWCSENPLIRHLPNLQRTNFTDAHTELVVYTHNDDNLRVSTTTYVHVPDHFQSRRTYIVNRTARAKDTRLRQTDRHQHPVARGEHAGRSGFEFPALSSPSSSEVPEFLREFAKLWAARKKWLNLSELVVQTWISCHVD